MFTFVANKYCSSIIFKNEDIAIECSPESIEDFNCYRMKEKNFDREPPNGMFYFKWDKHFVEFCTAKYGSGGGGSLLIKLKMTPEILQSLNDTLNEVIEHNLRNHHSSEDETDE